MKRTRPIAAPVTRPVNTPATRVAARTALALAACAGLAASTVHAQPAPAGAGQRNGAAAEAGAVPIRQITLYRSGVGYFQHQGTVRGDQTVGLPFDADKVNDILKSMVLLDLDGGRVEAVGYASKEPLARRLASFGVNIADNPSLAELFSRLRGAEVRVSTAEGPISGTILGVEARTVPAPGSDAVFQQHFLNLITGAGVRTVAIPSITTFELLDAELAGELNQALAALASNRAERSATVDLSFAGEGERRVVVGYVHETPVWKTSYRLILPDETAGEPMLQGWAIVENTTDQDWENVRLALVSGNPVAFTMDLHTPLFAARPMVPVPFAALARPRVYQEGLLGDIPVLPSMQAAEKSGRERDRRFATARTESGAAAPDVGGGDAAFLGGNARLSGMETLDADALSRYAAQSAASAGEVGEQFRYEIQAPVTIERQRSAMLPILTSSIKGERLSIYNPADNRQHPMRGVEIENTSGAELSPGPISVFDSSAYAGDAQIGFVGRGQSRLLSYAVDLDVRASMEQNSQSDLVRIRIVKGLVEHQMKQRYGTTYTFDNRDAGRSRTILVEHAKAPGWDLVKPEKKPRSETEAAWRFEAKADPGKATTLEVVLERTDYTRYAMTSLDVPTLLGYAQAGKASKAVVDAVRTAAEMQGVVSDLEARITELDSERAAIATDQSRIRDNMGRIDRTNELYARYLRKLNEQENRLEEMLEQRAELQEQLDAAKAELASYLKGLDVE